MSVEVPAALLGVCAPVKEHNLGRENILVSENILIKKKNILVKEQILVRRVCVCGRARSRALLGVCAPVCVDREGRRRRSFVHIIGY